MFVEYERKELSTGVFKANTLFLEGGGLKRMKDHHCHRSASIPTEPIRSFTLSQEDVL